VVKKKEWLLKMMVGDDLVDQILEFVGKTLVGRFFRVTLSKSTIWGWIETIGFLYWDTV
jgi:hypothetical protein